jgi:hypothetical protein
MHLSMVTKDDAGFRQDSLSWSRSVYPGLACSVGSTCQYFRLTTSPRIILAPGTLNQYR